jgi:hypothetical protein
MTDVAKVQHRRRERSRKKRRNLGGPPLEVQWAWFPQDMLQSPAWRQLIKHPAAVTVFMRIVLEHLRHGGKNNGNLIVTYADFREFGLSQHSIADGIALATALGFTHVKRGRPSREGDRYPSRYTLTIYPVLDQWETNDWRHIRTVEKAKEIVKLTMEMRKAERARRYDRDRKRPIWSPSIAPGDDGEQQHESETKRLASGS